MESASRDTKDTAATLRRENERLRLDNQALREENGRLGQEGEEGDSRAKLVYAQNFEQVRHLNAQMNAVPTFAMTLTGGLWFGAGLTQNIDSQIRFALLLFAGISNVSLVVVAIRIRDVLQSYLERAQDFYPPSTSDGTPNKPLMKGMSGYSMIAVYSVLMLTAAGLSFVGAIGYYWPFSVNHRGLGIIGIVAFGMILASVVFATRKKGNT